MIWLVPLIIASWMLVSAECNSTTLRPPIDDLTEDNRVINETIAKYGPYKDYTTVGLPGPEILLDDNIFSLENKFSTDGPGIYSLRVRTITKYFSYNGRYEEASVKKIGGEQIPVVKGQFGEHFERKAGGFYIRTIGYTLDENGYEQFLIALSTAETFIESTEEALTGGPGSQVGISSTALGSLIGGNPIG